MWRVALARLEHPPQTIIKRATCISTRPARKEFRIIVSVFDRLWRGSFTFIKKGQQRKKRYQGQSKKDGTALVVNRRIEHLRSIMRAKLAEGEYPETVAQQPKRNHSQRENGALPGRAQKKISGQQAGDK